QQLLARAPIGEDVARQERDVVFAKELLSAQATGSAWLPVHLDGFRAGCGLCRHRGVSRLPKHYHLRAPRSTQGRFAATAAPPPNRPNTLRERCVSMLTEAVMPARSGGSPGRSRSCSRTGRRCTTFTQLPEAFCGGRMANSAPVAGLMLSTSASQVMSG